MTLVAVAPHKFAKGMRGAPFAVAHLEDVLETHYPTDAHLVTYVLRAGGVPLLDQPRLLKSAVGNDGALELDGRRVVATVELLCADVDNPRHEPHASENAAWAMVAEIVSRVPTVGAYATSAGARVLQPVSEQLRAPDAEAVTIGWFRELERAGLTPDWGARDWTRLFRLPHVRRDGKPYRSPAVLLSEMRPIAPPAAAFLPAKQKTKKPPRTREQVKFAASVPVGFDALIRELGAAVRATWTDALGVGGGWHRLFLALSGALLEVVAPEHVRAVVGAISIAAGDSRLEDRLRAAEDTVRAWSTGATITSALEPWPLVAQALERHRIARQLEEPAAPASIPNVPDRSLEETTRLLEEVFRSAPDGLTVVRAQCGLGKTRAALAIAGERARRGGAHKLNTKTAIAVPTTALAEELAAKLRAEGLDVLRYFGPLSKTGPHDGWECRFRASGAAIAQGHQSVRRLFCKPCEYREECEACDGVEGPKDARIIVGPHALLAELDAAAGATGLLAIDEPPAVLEEDHFDDEQLEAAQKQLEHFERRYAHAMAPALAAVRRWLATGPLDETGSIVRAFELGVDPELLEKAFELVGATSAQEGVELALGEHPKSTSPPLEFRSVIAARGSIDLARRLGQASRVLAAIHRAVLHDGVTATLYERKAKRKIALAALNVRLERALQREGAVVVMAADAHLYLDAYERTVGYRPRFHDFAAADGAPIRRTLLQMRATRRAWRVGEPELPGQAQPVDGAIAAVAAWVLEDEASKAIGVVTFQPLEARVRRRLREALPDRLVEVAHYGAVRGLDGWRDHDAVVTLGDPWPDLGAAERGGVDAESWTRSELEQAHGRLRTVHRTRPGRALHVGRVVPSGWRPPVEVRQAPRGRPRRLPHDTGDVRSRVEAAGGIRAVARALNLSTSTVHRWCVGESRPDADALAAMGRCQLEAGSPEQAQGVPFNALYRDPIRKTFRNGGKRRALTMTQCDDEEED